jgi:hypothetical protein
MVNIKARLSRFKQNARNKITNSAQKFKENFSEAKSKPRSKRKSLFLGFTSVISIFGIVLIGSVLPAVAQDLPKKAAKPLKKAAKPGQVCPVPPPSPPSIVPSQQIIGGLAGAAGSICALAVSSGSFVIGAICGLIVVVGVLKAQGK